MGLQPVYPHLISVITWGFTYIDEKNKSESNAKNHKASHSSLVIPACLMILESRLVPISD
jgi:hypothetical protein